MADKPQPVKDPETGQFVQGFSGNPNGRPKGSRNKLGEAFLQDLYAAWQTQGAEVIARVIEEKPDALLRTIASILPKEVAIVRPEDDLSDEDMDAALAQIAALIADRDASRGAKPTHGGEGTA